MQAAVEATVSQAARVWHAGLLGAAVEGVLQGSALPQLPAEAVVEGAGAGSMAPFTLLPALEGQVDSTHVVSLELLA